MAKFLSIWRVNPNAMGPIDPAERLKLLEMFWVGMDNLIKTGALLEFGYFLGGTSGYVLSEGDAKGAFESALMTWPFFEGDTHEIVSYETGKEVLRRILKTQAEALATMKR